MPYDDYGHGTHVAGLIGSSGATSNSKYAGIAPGAKLLSLKVLDGKGTGKTSDVINALEFAVANRTRFGINVINLSLGHPIYESATTDPLVQAVEAAIRAGIVVVVAAGNYGYNPLTGDDRLRRDRLPRQLAVGDHGRRGLHQQHADADRRSPGGLQLAWAHVVRRVCET